MKPLDTLRKDLDHVLARDAGRLRGRWRRLSAQRAGGDADAVAELAGEIAASKAAAEARRARTPAATVDPDLPIAAHAGEITRLIERHQVVVVAGETGSGKTTQLPKLCLAAGRGARGLIGCTQPRRIAARSVAGRVAAELGGGDAGLVGFQVRFQDQTPPDALVKFMTDGILLAETRSDPWLSAYDTVIIDEAHERSLNIDFLLGYFKRLLPRRPDLKLLITSATIDTARFAAHFDNAPVVEVAGRGYPVETRWMHAPGQFSRGDGPGAGISAEAAAREDDPLGLAETIVAAVDDIGRSDPRGDILVFLPGEREIRDAHLALSRRRYRATEVMGLYARLSAAEQDRVFRPGPERRIVLATNVAETSLTVPRIRYVIDSGTARVKRYSPRSGLERLHVEPISQAAADQRKGRCGRLGPGVCYRLYDQADFERRPRYTDPEILRASLAGVMLRMLALGLGDPAAFPFVEPPSDRAFADGHRRLLELGAVGPGAGEPSRRRRRRGPAARGDGPGLTTTGEAMAALPVDVALARMLVEANALGCLKPMLVLAAFLSIQDPRERPADARAEADAAHARFADPRSEFIGILRLWQAYTAAHAEHTQSRLRDWCREHFLSFLRMREWRELHRQLRLAVAELGWDESGDPGAGLVEADSPTARPESASAPEGRRRRRSGRRSAAADAPPRERQALRAEAAAYETLHRCLLSGWPTQVGRRDERGQYRGPRERRFAVFPGSSLAKSPPNWLLAGQILDLSRVYAMTCARIEPGWIEAQAAHLVRRSWKDPHWSRKRGSVIAHEQVSLFGLTLVERRPVQFGSQDPALAHEVFLREALARCAIDTRAGFAAANARVLDEAFDYEQRHRRAGLVLDEDARAAFFAGKLPGTVHDRAGLEAWWQQAGAAARAAMHWSLADLLTPVPGSRPGDFPAALEFAGQELALEYRFLPGDPADGVTLRVPLAWVNAVEPNRCEWLVPGLLQEKVAGLIRSLPRALRRNFVPAPDFAAAFAEANAPGPEPLTAALATWLQRVTGVAITPGAFDAAALEPHLRMNFRIEDGNGATLAEGRDLASLQAAWAGAAREAFSREAQSSLTREAVTGFDFDEIPRQLRSDAGVVAFPALVDLGETVALRVYENPGEATAAHRGGVERLLRRALATPLRQAARGLPVARGLALQWAPFGSLDALREDITEAALRSCLHGVDLDLRDREAFASTREHLARALFSAAAERAQQAEAVVAAHAELKPWLEPPLLGFARANYEDLEEQLAALLPDGFLRELPAGRLAELPRYLAAMRLRAERLRHDPARDQARMLTVQGYWRDYLALRARGGLPAAGLDELRWAIEELRVSLFAQDLGTRGTISPKRVARQIAALRNAAQGAAAGS